MSNLGEGAGNVETIGAALRGQHASRSAHGAVHAGLQRVGRSQEGSVSRARSRGVSEVIVSCMCSCIY